MSDRPRLLRAGRVGRPHGLDGSFHVTHPNAPLLALGTTVVVEHRELRVTRRAGTEQQPIVRLEGHEDRHAAESLRGKELLVARADAPELEPDEWWEDELVGCAVHDAGRPVGTVRRLLALPSCEVLEVRRGDGQAELLVPLIGEAVREVDVERRQIEIDLRFLGVE